MSNEKTDLTTYVSHAQFLAEKIEDIYSALGTPVPEDVKESIDCVNLSPQDVDPACADTITRARDALLVRDILKRSLLIVKKRIADDIKPRVDALIEEIDQNIDLAVTDDEEKERQKEAPDGP